MSEKDRLGGGLAGLAAPGRARESEGEGDDALPLSRFPRFLLKPPSQPSAHLASTTTRMAPRKGNELGSWELPGEKKAGETKVRRSYCVKELVTRTSPVAPPSPAHTVARMAYIGARSGGCMQLCHFL